MFASARSIKSPKTFVRFGGLPQAAAQMVAKVSPHTRGRSGYIDRGHELYARPCGGRWGLESHRFFDLFRSVFRGCIELSFQ